MDESRQQNALDALRDWSKWLIGFNFAAASGCIIVLLGGARGLPRIFLIAAIISFVLSVLSSTLLVKMLVNVAENLPLRSKSGDPISIAEYKVSSGVTVGGLSWLQFGLLVVAIIFFIMWVVLRPAPM
jgi:hypothetical protein